MSKKRNFKKGFALLTALTMVAGISVNVSAATHNTTTSYTMGETKVSVTSTIDGVTSGEQITYLAYDSEQAGITKDNIVFIDQQPATGTSCVFNYKTEISKLGTTLVKFGAQTTPASEITVQTGGTNQIDTYDITVTASGGGSVSGVSPISIVNGYTFIITPDPGNKVASLTFDGVPVDLSRIIANASTISYTVKNVTRDCGLDVTFDTKTPVAQSNVNPGIKFGTPVLDGGNTNNITTFSSIAVTTADEALGYEYGVLFSYVPNPKFADQAIADQAIYWSGAVAGTLTKAVAGAGAIKYKAFGKGVDGKYAVKLADGGSGYLQVAGATYYTTPYLVINGDYEHASYGTSTPFAGL